MANQTLKAQHQKELEGREEEVEQIKTTMNKKLKVLGDQIEELHEEKQQAVKVGRVCECVCVCVCVYVCVCACVRVCLDKGRAKCMYMYTCTILWTIEPTIDEWALTCMYSIRYC